MMRPSDLANGAPDEADALRRAERLVEAAAQSGLDLAGLDAAAHRIATLACQSAPYLATLLTRDPHRLVRVSRDPYLRREKPREVLVAEVTERAAGARTQAELQAALRNIRADEMVRLGVRELELGLDTEVGRELARLADACFDAAIAFWDRELRARYGAPQYTDDDGELRDAGLAVIGMGKLGGEELNFTSDVDVIYTYASDHGAAGPLSLPADDVALLAQGYRFLRAIEHRLRIVHDQPIHRLSELPDELDKLARRSGFPDGEALRARVAHWQHEIRAAYLRVVA